MSSSSKLDNNPETTRLWWKKAKDLRLDPREIDLLTHESHSASKFDEKDFIHLKAVWKNKGVDKLHISEHVRPEHVKALQFLLNRSDSSKTSQNSQASHTLR